MSDRTDQWTDWLEQHGAGLLLFARQWISCRTDAEDVVQEAFVRFWRRRQDVTEPLGFLYATVKHCALDSHRQRTRQSRREAAVARREGESLLLNRPEQDERGAAIDAALRSLPIAQREVLVLKIWGGLTFPQIGSALKISANTAASRYRYALAGIREPLMKESIP